MKMFRLFCFLTFALVSLRSTAQEKRDSLKIRNQKVGRYYEPFSERRFGYGYWMLGVYGGTENFETIDFGINFPIINQNMPGKLFKKRIKEDEMPNVKSFVPGITPTRSERYWIPTPLPKRLALHLGLERNFASLVYRPEIGLILTPFSLFGGMGTGNNYLNHILISTEFLPSIRNYQSTYRVGAGYMLKLKKPVNLVFRYHGVRFYFLYHYNLSKDWSGHLFTFQVNYNKEPYHKKFNPINHGYRNW